MARIEPGTSSVSPAYRDPSIWASSGDLPRALRELQVLEAEGPGPIQDAHITGATASPLLQLHHLNILTEIMLQWFLK